MKKKGEEKKESNERKIERKKEQTLSNVSMGYSVNETTRINFYN